MADYRISDLTPQMTEEIACAAILLQRVCAFRSWATLAEAEQERWLRCCTRRAFVSGSLARGRDWLDWRYSAKAAATYASHFAGCAGMQRRGWGGR